MPIIYRCKNCGYVFHYLEHVGQDYIGVPSVNEVLGRYGYTCPKCKARLTQPAQSDIIITSMKVARKREMLPIRIGSHYYVKVDTSILNINETPVASQADT